MLKADNRGEGGILALVALAHNSLPEKSRWHMPLLTMGVFGAALFYGDSVITPAISVLSATEGLEVATPFFKPYIVPIAIGHSGSCSMPFSRPVRQGSGNGSAP